MLGLHRTSVAADKRGNIKEPGTEGASYKGRGSKSRVGLDCKKFRGGGGGGGGQRKYRSRDAFLRREGVHLGKRQTYKKITRGLKISVNLKKSDKMKDFQLSPLSKKQTRTKQTQLLLD